MKLRARIVVPLASSLLASLLSMGAFVVFRVGAVLRENALARTVSVAYENVAFVKEDLDRVSTAAAHAAALLAGLSAGGTPEEAVSAAVGALLDAERSASGAWAAWKSGAFGSDPSGFAVYRLRDPDGIRSVGGDRVARDGEEGWAYSVPLAGGKPYVSAPRIGTGGMRAITFSSPIPGTSGAEGVVGLEYPLDRLAVRLDAISEALGGRSFIVANEGELIVRDSRSTGAADLSDLLGKFRAEQAAAAIYDGKRFSYEDSATGAFAVFVPIRFAENLAPWTLGVVLPLGAVTRDAWQVVLIVAALVAAALALCLGAVWAVSGAITRPLAAASAAMEDIARGGGDLRAALPGGNGRDEVGLLIDSFNGFSATLRGLVGSVSEAARELESAGGELAAHADGAAAASAQISASSEGTLARASRQSRAAADATRAAIAIAEHAAILDAQVADESILIDSSAEALGSIVAGVSDIAAQTARAAESFRDLDEAAAEGIALQEGISALAGKASQRSAALEEANEAIASIAGATAMLAMNAAIEAAHAGEAGAGFAVVADEMRRLAETAAERSAAIGTELEAIAGAVREVSAASERADGAYVRIARGLGKTRGVLGALESAADRQRRESAGIEEALAAFRSSSAQVRTASAQVREEAEAIRLAAETLEGAAADIVAAAGDSASGARTISAAATEVARLSKGNRRLIDSIMDRLGRFVV